MSETTALDWLQEIESKHTGQPVPADPYTITLDEWHLALGAHTAMVRREKRGSGTISAAITITLAEIVVSVIYHTRWNLDRVGAIMHNGVTLLPRPVATPDAPIPVLAKDDPQAIVIGLHGDGAVWRVLGWCIAEHAQDDTIPSQKTSYGWAVPPRWLMPPASMPDLSRSVA